MTKEEAIAQTRWISAINKLPKTDESVLATDGTNMFVAWYFEEWQEWDSDDSCFEKATPIIAWMPLPEPYSAESEGKNADSIDIPEETKEEAQKNER